MGDREGRPYAGLVAELFGASPMPASRWPRLGRYGPPPRTKETKPCWIRDGRPRGSPLRGPRRRVVRGVAHAGFPMASFRSVRAATSYEGNEAVLDSGWATARVAPTRASSPSCSGRRPCRLPDGLVWVGTGRHLVRRKRSRAGFGMGDGAPYGRDRVAPTRASSPSCSGRRPCRLPDGLVWVGTGRRKGVPYDRRAGVTRRSERSLASVLEKPTSDSVALRRRRPTSRSAQRRRCLSRRGASPRRSRYADRGGFRWRRQLA